MNRVTDAEFKKAIDVFILERRPGTLANEMHGLRMLCYDVAVYATTNEIIGESEAKDKNSPTG